MTLDIYIKSFNRPHCLQSLLSSLDSQKSHPMVIDKIILFQDGPRRDYLKKDTKLIDECVKIFKKHVPDGLVKRSSDNIGPNGNCHREWEAMLETTSNAVLNLEDDIELSPVYLSVITQLLNYAESNSNIGFVSAVGTLGATNEMHKIRAHEIIPMGYLWGIHRWGLAATKQCIVEMAPVILAYFEFTKKIGYSGTIHDYSKYKNMVQEWQRSYGFCQDYPMIGYDSAYDMAAVLLNKLHISTYAAFARSTGMIGTSFNEDYFKRYNFHQTVVEREAPSYFNYYSYERLLQILTLNRRFNLSHLNGLISEGTGSSVKYNPMSRDEVINILYQSIQGWNFNDMDKRVHRLNDSSSSNVKSSNNNVSLTDIFRKDVAV